MNIGTERIEQIIKEYSALIFRTAYQFLKNYHDAQDVTQDVCVALALSDKDFENETKLRNWLITVTLNKCRDLHKSAWHRKCEPLGDNIAVSEPEAYEMMEELWKLPDNYRTTLYLYYYEELTVDEIADVLGKSRNTIGSWLTRGKRKLKQILLEGGKFNA